MAYKSTIRRLMQVFTILLICLSAYRDGFSQNNDAGKSVTIAAKRTTYGEIFEQVLKQTGTTVWFSDDIGKRVAKDVSLKNISLQEAMNKILPKDLEWVFRGKDIIVKKKGISESGVVNPNNNPPSNTSLSENTTDNLVDVTGKVTDENGDPIPGATVLVKGSQNGAITLSNGDFVIRGVPRDGILVFRSVSFTTREIPVSGRQSIGIAQLTKAVRVIDDVIVLAYTTTTNEKLIGNVSKVKAKDIQGAPVANPLLAVVGRVPGVTITQSSGYAGSGVEIIIQGQNSLLNGLTPFYVVDGVPYAQSLLPNFGEVAGTSGRGIGGGPISGNPLNYLSPSDIESIEILKDADATAIYGSRAANGAILITTKRSKGGKLKLDLNVQQGVSHVNKQLKLLNTSEYIQVRKEALSNDGLNIGPADYDINGTWDSTRTRNWQKELIGNKGNYTNVQLGVSGGGANVDYLISGNYRRETSVLPTTLGDEKSSARVALNFKSDDQRVKVGLSVSYLTDANRLPTTDLTGIAMTLSPNNPDLLKSNGELNWAPDANGTSTVTSNPMATLTSYYSNKTSNLLSNINATFEIVPSLFFKTTLGYNKLNTNEISTSPQSSFQPEMRPYRSASARFGFNEISSWIAEPQLFLNRGLGSGKLTVILGSTFQSSSENRRSFNAEGFPNDLVLENINAAGRITSLYNGTVQSMYRYNAAFFQVAYDFKDKYLINLSGRRDGSSRFGPENRLHSFGSIGSAWIFSKESFMEKFRRVINYGKIKASYGTTGNDQIGDYSFLSLYQNNNTDLLYRGVTSLGISRIANPQLKWEETRKLSMGLEMGFFDDRILFSGVYYRNRSSNMIVPAVIPATAGSSAALTENLPAVILNTGIEMSLTTVNIKSRHFLWTSSANVTVPRNKLKSFGNLNSSTYSTNFDIGQPSNYIRSYRSAGVNPETGMYQFYDKDGKITENPQSDVANSTRAINPNQTVYGGLTNNLSYRGFSLDFLFQFVKQLGENKPTSYLPGEMQNQSVSILNRWQKEGDVKPIQKYSFQFPYQFSYYYQYQSDAYWQDASFIRLKNVNLSFTFPKNWIANTKISTARIYFSAQNLLTITSFDGLDPETRSNFVLPPLRVYTAGLQVTL